MTFESGSGNAAGAGVGPEVFALTDEQIVGLSGDDGAPSAEVDVEVLKDVKDASPRVTSTSEEPSGGRDGNGLTPEGVSYKGQGEQGVPQWLAERMKDPWHGEEAKEFWDGKQRAETEAAAYREVFATPADARALKELYPGGVSEAKSVVERARALDEIDAAFYRGDGEARSALAARMMQQDPVAFREMVEAGVRLLDGQGKFVAPNEQRGTSEREVKSAQPGIAVPQEVVRAYGEFERTANAELEKSVGSAITRVMEQALPNLRTMGATGNEGAQAAAPLPERLAQAVREDVEWALKSDVALGEQVARILSGKRFDEGSRAQVVRLIDARAQQLVPGAVRRVVGAWTEATLGTRGNRRESAMVAPRQTSAATRRNEERVGEPAKNAKAAVKEQENPAPRGRRVDYRRVSDEEILGM